MFGMVWYCMVCYAILMYAMHGTYFIYIYIPSHPDCIRMIFPLYPQ